MFPGYQLMVQQFIETHGLETDVSSRLLDLVSEVGELAKESLKITNYGKQAFFPHDDTQWSAELADVFFALICIANSTGVDMDEALDAALQKYATRLSSKGDVGSGR